MQQEITRQAALFDDRGRMPILDKMRYYYSKTDNENFIPRMEVAMADPVELPLLQTAAEAAVSRYRAFRLQVVEEGGQYYLTDNPLPPVVHACDGTRHTLCSRENNRHMVWIGAEDCRIYVEFFHGISDGHGILLLIDLLLQHYCALRYDGTPLPIASEPPECTDEYRESLAFLDPEQPVSGKQPGVFHAFQLPDPQIPPGKECFLYALTVDAEQLDTYMRRNGSSRTAVLALMMNRAIARRNRLSDRPIVAAVAANLRGIYGAEATLRDCTEVLPLWYDSGIHALPLREQLVRSREMIQEGLLPEARLSAALENLRSNAMLESRMPSLRMKQQLCRKAHAFSYDRYTYSISSVGHVVFGDRVDPHVAAVSAITCANTYPIIIESVRYGDYYHIRYTTRLIDDPYVRLLQQQLLEAGIPCTCGQRENHIEALADF